MSNQNPYQPPKWFEGTVRPNSSFRYFTGPAIYILFFGIIGATLGIWLVEYGEIVVPFLACFGFVVGGLVFRVRSRKWPVDSNARSRQVFFSCLIIAGLPFIIGLFAGYRYQGKAMVLMGLLAGIGISIGIFLSGIRRFKTEKQTHR